MSYEAMRDQCSAQIFSLSLVLIITRQSRTPITTLTNTSSHLTFTVHHRTSLSHVTCHVYMRYVAHYVAAPPHSSQLTASSHPPTSRDSVLRIQKSAFY